MQIGNDPEGHNIGRRTGQEKRQGCARRDPAGQQHRDHGSRPGCADVDRNSKHGEERDLQVGVAVVDKPATPHQRPDQGGDREPDKNPGTGMVHQGTQPGLDSTTQLVKHSARRPLGLLRSRS